MQDKTVLCQAVSLFLDELIATALRELQRFVFLHNLEHS